MASGRGAAGQVDGVSDLPFDDGDGDEVALTRTWQDEWDGVVYCTDENDFNAHLLELGLEAEHRELTFGRDGRERVDDYGEEQDDDFLPAELCYKGVLDDLSDEFDGFHADA